MLSTSQEIIQEKKDMLEAHWSTILAVPITISHQNYNEVFAGCSNI